jgi:hypothetical protein
MEFSTELMIGFTEGPFEVVENEVELGGIEEDWVFSV